METSETVERPEYWILKIRWGYEDYLDVRVKDVHVSKNKISYMTMEGELWHVPLYRVKTYSIQDGE